MDSESLPTNLCLHFPDLSLTRQLEHYANLMSGLFEHAFVLFIVRSDSNQYYLASDENRPKWVAWVFTQAAVASPGGLQELRFFLPGYHCCFQTIRASESDVNFSVLMVRNTRVALTELQEQALDMLAHAALKIVSIDQIRQLQRTSHLKSHWPFHQTEHLSGQAIVQWQDGQIDLVGTTDVFSSCREEFFEDDNIQCWLSQQLAGLALQELAVVRLFHVTNICELRLWRISADQWLLTLTDFTAERQVRHLQQQDRLLHGLFDSDLAGMIGLNEHSELVFANSTARELLWLPAQVHPADKFNLHHVVFQQFTDHDNLVRVDPSGFLQALTKTQLVRFRLDFPDGSQKVIDCRGQLRQTIDNPEVVAFCMLLDVSEQFQLQQVLSEMRQHMENLLNFSPVVLYQAMGDLRNGFLYVSPNVADILGCTVEQILSDPMFFFHQVHPQDQVLFTQEWTESYQEYRFWSHAQQSYLWLKDIRNTQSNDVNSSYGAITNISARKLAELEQDRLSRALARQQKHLSETLQAMTDGVVTINAQGEILSFNTAVCQLFGYTSEQLLGAQISMLMPETHAQQHQHYLNSYMQTGQKHIMGKGRRLMARHQSGREFPIRLSIAELPMDELQQRFFVGSLHDLTQAEQQQDQLVQASKLSAIGTLTSGIAHDFNNILGIVRGYAELLSMQSDEKVVKTAHNLIKAADRGSALTKSLLDFSSNRSRQTQSTELGQLLQELTPMLKEACGPSSGVKLVLQPAAAPLWVTVEKGGLEDVLLNMVINAVHATAPAGVITVGFCQKEVRDSVHFVESVPVGHYACLTISDTGRGMSEQVQHKIFEPFFSTKGAQGTGLGLAQVFGFIRRSQGGITVESTEGVGTRFELYLPVATQISPPVPAAQSETFRPVAADKSPTATAAQILLVDDDVELLDVHATILEAAGFSVCSCNSAKAALQQLEQQRFALLISDILMPEMNGFELCSAAALQQPDLAMLLVSAFADENLIDDAANRIRYQQRLEKPVRASLLIKRVRELLSKVS
jgi:PAS domain S-box-containing protein